MMITFLVEQYLGNQVGLVSTRCNPITPTCSAPPFSCCRVEHHKRLHSPTACPIPSLSHNPMSVKYGTVAPGSAHACFTAFSIHKENTHTKTDLPWSQNLLLTLKLASPACLFLQNSISHWQPKFKTRGGQHRVQVRADFQLNHTNEMRRCHLIFYIQFPISRELIYESLGSLGSSS